MSTVVLPVPTGQISYFLLSQRSFRPSFPAAFSSLGCVIGVGIRESLELHLVHGGEEVLVHRGQLGHLLRERLVEVRDVQGVALQGGKVTLFSK